MRRLNEVVKLNKPKETLRDSQQERVGEDLQELKIYVLQMPFRLTRRQIGILPKESRMPRRLRPTMEPIRGTMNNR